MKTIYRYRLTLTEIQSVSMHAAARILSVQHRENSVDGIDMWAMVNCDNPTVTRKIVIMGTGHPVPGGDLAYLGTVQLVGGDYVFHVFEDVT